MVKTKHKLFEQDETQQMTMISELNCVTYAQSPFYFLRIFFIQTFLLLVFFLSFQNFPWSVLKSPNLGLLDCIGM